MSEGTGGQSQSPRVLSPRIDDLAHMVVVDGIFDSEEDKAAGEGCLPVFVDE